MYSRPSRPPAAPVDSLMAEISEGHIRFMMLAEFESPRKKAESIEELVDLIRAYVK